MDSKANVFSWQFLCAIILVAAISINFSQARETDEATLSQVAGPYTVELITVPEKLEAASARIVVRISKGEVPAAEEAVWLELHGTQGTVLSGAYVTNGAGEIPIQYHFERPGFYKLVVEIDSHRVELPLEVHGQYILLFGFLAAVFVVVALLLDKM